jgi:acetolactate synthase-1/2/3 large subunit
VSRALAAAGVTRAFGFPGGGSNLALLEGFRAAGIEFVLAHTEVSAALMACATAELTGVPGVVVVGNGPGLASVVDGVAHAWLDRVPLLVLSDRSSDAELATTGHQVLDQRALLAPVVKWTATLSEATLARAVEVALTPPWGPVHLELPRGESVAAGGEAGVAGAAAGHDGGDLVAIGEALGRAQRPVIAAGLEAARVLDAGALQALAEALGAPVLTTYKAKGVLDERHPLWAGILTGGALEAPTLEQADAILAVGLDPVELLAKPWPYTAPLYALRVSGAGAEYGNPTTWIGDLAHGVRELASVKGVNRGVTKSPLDALRIDSDTPLTGWRIVETLAEELPRDTVVAVDAGAHMFPATWFWPAARPRRFLISNGLATMGFAVPAAVAAAHDGLAVAITGDGGMAYGAFELETAARLNARVLVVVCNDASLSLIRIKHHDRAPFDFGPTRFDALAGAFGVAAFTAADEPAMREAVRAALATHGPALIDARLSGAEYARTLNVVRG